MHINGANSSPLILIQAMQLPPPKSVLTVTDNKRQLIRIICEELVQNKDVQRKHSSEHIIGLTIEKDIPIVLNKDRYSEGHHEDNRKRGRSFNVQQMVTAANENQN